MGGRQKGTPNKNNAAMKEWLQRVLDDNREQFEADLRQLMPEERVRVLSGLFNYFLPKQQAITAEASVQAEYAELERLLKTAPDEVVDKIAAKVMEMQEANTDEQ